MEALKEGTKPVEAPRQERASKGEWQHAGKVWRCWGEGTEGRAVASHRCWGGRRCRRAQRRAVLGRVLGTRKGGKARKEKIVHVEVRVKQWSLPNPVDSPSFRCLRFYFLTHVSPSRMGSPRCQDTAPLLLLAPRSVWSLRGAVPPEVSRGLGGEPQERRCVEAGGHVWCKKRTENPQGSGNWKKQVYQGEGRTGAGKLGKTRVRVAAACTKKMTFPWSKVRRGVRHSQCARSGGRREFQPTTAPRKSVAEELQRNSTSHCRYALVNVSRMPLTNVWLGDFPGVRSRILSTPQAAAAGLRMQHRAAPGIGSGRTRSRADCPWAQGQQRWKGEHWSSSLLPLTALWLVKRKEQAKCGLSYNYFFI